MKFKVLQEPETKCIILRFVLIFLLMWLVCIKKFSGIIIF